MSASIALPRSYIKKKKWKNATFGRLMQWLSYCKRSTGGGVHFASSALAFGQ